MRTARGILLSGRDRALEATDGRCHTQVHFCTGRGRCRPPSETYSNRKVAPSIRWLRLQRLRRGSSVHRAQYRRCARHEGDRVVGIVSERDVARNVILESKTERETAVTEIMTEKISVHPSATVEECMALMTHKRIRHLPVVEDGRVVGIVSIGDLVNSLISQKQFIIEQLEGYITGRL